MKLFKVFFFGIVLFVDIHQQALAYIDIRANNLTRSVDLISVIPLTSVVDDPNSAHNTRRAFSKLDFNQIPDLGSEDAVISAFSTVRDERFFHLEYLPNFPRRLPWLWPNDGCYLRSFYAAEILRSKGFLPLKQLFVFAENGNDFEAKPEWREGVGPVWWRYHVVLAARVGSQVWVIDPAIDLEKPLKVDDWLNAFVQNRTALTASICNDQTFGPNNNCLQPDSNPLDGMTPMEWATLFLPYEWWNIKSRGLDPYKILGDSPPWAH